MSESSHGEHYPKELRELALKLLTNGPHKVEKTPRRVRVLFDGIWILDTTSARHVWEHPYYPQYYVPTSAITGADLKKNKAVDDDGSVYFAELDSKGSHPGAYTDRVLIFEKGPLTGLTRLDFGTMGE